jgi:hypothetical protein
MENNSLNNDSVRVESAPRWIWYVLSFLTIIIFVTLLLMTKKEEAFIVAENNSNSPNSFDKLIFVEEFPTSGSGYTPQKIYINWHRTHLRPQGRVRYTYESNPSIWIVENGPASGNSGIDEKRALTMPIGNYIATSEEPSNVYISWWQ